MMLILPDILADFLQVSATFIGDHIEKSGWEEDVVPASKGRRFTIPRFSERMRGRFPPSVLQFFPIVPARHTSELK
jgi:hypothetical protein